MKTKCCLSWGWVRMTTTTRIWVHSHVERPSCAGDSNDEHLVKVERWAPFIFCPRALLVTSPPSPMALAHWASQLVSSPISLWRDFYHEPTHVSRKKIGLAMKKNLNTTLTHLIWCGVELVSQVNWGLSVRSQPLRSWKLGLYQFTWGSAS